jgi:hypothetical protein
MHLDVMLGIAQSTLSKDWSHPTLGAEQRLRALRQPCTALLKGTHQRIVTNDQQHVLEVSLRELFDRIRL